MFKKNQRIPSTDIDSVKENAKEIKSLEKEIEELKKKLKIMEKELENAKIMLKNYQNELKALQKKSNKNKFTADNLLEMENEVKKKEAYIKELNDDIKNLNIVKRKQ